MAPKIYTLQLDETALNSFLATTTHASHAYQMNTIDRVTCEAVWDFGEHLIDAITDHSYCSLEDVFRMAFGYNEAYPKIDLPADVVDEYLEALEELTKIDSAIRRNPYQDSLDTFRRNEEVLNRQ